MDLRDRFEARIPPGGFVGRLLTLSSSSSSNQPGFEFSDTGVYRIAASMAVWDPATHLAPSLPSDTVEVRVVQ
jgi:hypothetical protein